jgi:hypothetical protein
MSTDERNPASDSDAESVAGLDPTQLIPELFGKFFEFFRPGHTEGIAPARIKELARLKVAEINECDT